MSNVSSIALSGMNAAALQLQTSAHNIANAQTPAFRRQQMLRSAEPAGGVQVTLTRAAAAGDALADDLVAQREAALVYRANLAVLKTHDNVLGSLLDAHA